jgi:hypothetical protein
MPMERGLLIPDVAHDVCQVTGAWCTVSECLVLFPRIPDMAIRCADALTAMAKVRSDNSHSTSVNHQY